MAPSSTSLRRICTMMGTCSTATGQISTQAMQVRQDHRVSMATCPGPLPWMSSSAASGTTPDSSVALGKFPQAQYHVAGRQRRAHGARGAGFVAAAALGAGVEIQQLLPIEIGDLGGPDLCLRLGDARQPLRRQRVAHHQRGRRREDVLDLGEGDQRDEHQRDQSVKPPQAVPQQPASACARARARAWPRATSAPTGDHQRVSQTSGRSCSQTSLAASST